MSTSLHSQAVAIAPVSGTESNLLRKIDDSVHELEAWIRSNDYAGYEPFDLMNSPYAGRWSRHLPFSVLIRQFGRRWSGLKTRQLLRVSASKNCKALGLVLSGYCNLSRCGEDWQSEADYLKSELRRLRSPKEQEYCWGYDWDAISLKAGNVMPAFSPNAVATVFCASALLDVAEVFTDPEALEMAKSAGRFFVTRLNRSVDTADEMCFSYTPTDRTRIYNSTALVSAFLTRLSVQDDALDYLGLARRNMRYLVNQQLAGGAWYYGAKRWQRWIDSFHTGYILDSMLNYRKWSGESLVDDAIRNGYNYYKRTFFPGRAPAYYHNRRYPIDIHSCAQAVLTYCNFTGDDETAISRALYAAEWTLDNMRSEQGTFFYQQHRFWTNCTPYMRWGQAWMLNALSRLKWTVSATLRTHAGEIPSRTN